MLFMLMCCSLPELLVPAFAVLYNWLVRPHLEYAMQACSPNLVADTGCLEQIQRLATRFVKGFHRLPYEERLRRLSLDSLNRVRLRGDVIVVYKMFSVGLDMDSSLFFSASAACLERACFQCSEGSQSAPSRKVDL